MKARSVAARDDCNGPSCSRVVSISCMHRAATRAIECAANRPLKGRIQLMGPEARSVNARRAGPCSAIVPRRSTIFILVVRIVDDTSVFNYHEGSPTGDGKLFKAANARRNVQGPPAPTGPKALGVQDSCPQDPVEIAGLPGPCASELVRKIDLRTGFGDPDGRPSHPVTAEVVNETKEGEIQ